MKVGDLVEPYASSFGIEKQLMVVVGFNKSGEGGKHYVHVLLPDGTIEVFLSESLVVVNESR